MVVAIFGESCVGKSSLAESLKIELNAQVYTGKDYLRMAKSEPEARELFAGKLNEAVMGDNIIYVISEKDHLKLLPEGAVRVLMTADINLILDRFACRMGGKLPDPVKKMLEAKHGSFDARPWDYHIHNSENADEICKRITELAG